MHFDTSPRTLKSLNAIMRSDPRVIRWTMLKLGERIEDVVKPMESTTNRILEPASKVGAGLGDGLGKGLGQDRYGVMNALEDAVSQGEVPRF